MYENKIQKSRTPNVNNAQLWLIRLWIIFIFKMFFSVSQIFNGNYYFDLFAFVSHTEYFLKSITDAFKISLLPCRKCISLPLSQELITIAKLLCILHQCLYNFIIYIYTHHLYIHYILHILCFTFI